MSPSVLINCLRLLLSFSKLSKRLLVVVSADEFLSGGGGPKWFLLLPDLSNQEVSMHDILSIHDKRSHGELIQLIRDGDSAVFGELYERFSPMVHAVIFSRVRNQHLAEDLAQDVFINAFAKLCQLKNPNAFPAWIRSMAIRMTINCQVRKKGPCELVDGEQWVVDTATTEPVEQLMRGETCKGLRDALSLLPTIDQEAVDLFYYQRLSLADMSALLGKPIGTVKRRLHVARRRLGAQLEASAA